MPCADCNQVTLTGIACTVLCFAPRFRQRTWRNRRAGIFTLFALVGFFPLYHTVQLYGLEQAKRQMGWSWFTAGGLLYISGALIYAVCELGLTCRQAMLTHYAQVRFPERLRPGTFDVWGSSHQIFHVMVVFGAILHFNGILVSLDYHHDPITKIVRQCRVLS